MTSIELRQLHCYFEYLFEGKLYKLLKCAKYEIDEKVIYNLTKYCTYYQKHRKLLGHFKFIFKKNGNFKYSILIDIIYIDSNLILYVVNKTTRFQAAK